MARVPTPTMCTMRSARKLQHAQHCHALLAALAAVRLAERRAAHVANAVIEQKDDSLETTVSMETTSTRVARSEARACMMCVPALSLLTGAALGAALSACACAGNGECAAATLGNSRITSASEVCAANRRHACSPLRSPGAISWVARALVRTGGTCASLIMLVKQRAAAPVSTRRA